jgi:tRNA (guanine-N7-)-methyltransferase
VVHSSEETRAFFGRRKGHNLRAEQERRFSLLLPQIKVQGITPGNFIDPYNIFAKTLGQEKPEKLVLEIGFGGGEHLSSLSKAHPDWGFIGCEPFVNGVAKMLASIEEHDLNNVRLWDDDAVHLLDCLPDACIDDVYLLYPDPWPKWRQRKRRFVSEANLERLARVIKPGGRFRFASDIDDYVGWTLRLISYSKDFSWPVNKADDWRLPWQDWIRTRYEAKAFREGRRPSYLTFYKAKL